MNKYNITQKLISLITALTIILGMTFTVQASADIDENITATITDGGKLVTESIQFSSNKITLAGTSELSEGESVAYVVYKNDASNKASKTNLLEIGETKIQSDSSFSLTFGLKTQDTQEALIIDMKAASQSEKAKVELTIEDEELTLSAKIEEVKSLLDKCEADGINTAYERVKHSAAQKVLQMLPTFTANGETESYEYNMEVAFSLLSEAKTALQSYIDGTAQPMAVTKPSLDVPTLQGQTFYSKAEDKPIFYVGYGHWSASDIEMYSDLGVNLYHYEIGPENLLKKAAPVTAWDIKEVHSNKITYLVEYSTENGGSVKVPASSGSGQVWLSQTVRVEPNTQYTFGVDFKCASASSLRLRVNSTDKWIYDSKNDSAITNWKTGSSSYTTGADETELTFSVILHNNSSELFFDNAFVKDSAGNNLLQNADFSVENTEMFTVNTAYAEHVKNVFKRAENSGVSIMLLTAMHYFPDYMYTYDPTIANGDVSTFPKFMPFNPTHPEVIKVMNKFLEELIPLVKDSKALHSICLSNEPQFEVKDNQAYYLDAYHAMLKQKYGTPEAMSDAYGTKYSSFEAVAMPKDTGRNSSERQKLAHFNDYRLFNESILTEYHKAISDKTEELAPNVLRHTKGMASMNAIGTSGNRIQLGINNEELSKFLTLNGCDAWAYYGDSKDTLMGQTMWYDYMTSVKNAPVINSEDHILKDSSTLTRNDEELAFNMADIWQGAVHGRGATALWLYDNSERTKNGTGYYNSNLTRRADYLAQIGKTALDLNRLGEEVAAINNSQARVAILYSDSSLVLNPYALNASYVAYQQAMFNGEKVFFVNETDPTTLNKNDIELLIVPCSNYMKAQTLSKIKKHIDDGGRVLLLNANSKSWMDENGNAHNEELLQSVTSRSETASFYLGSDMYTYDASSAVVNKLKEELNKLKHTVDVTSANSSTEWLIAEVNGDCVINLCNYGDEDTQISISAEGYSTDNAYDMISGEKLGASFTLSPYEPKLIKIEKTNGFDFYAVNENGTKTEISKLTSLNLSVSAKYIGANPNEEYAHIVSVCENGILKQVFIAEGNADTDGTITSEKAITVDKDIDLSKCTVKTFLFNGFQKMKPYMPSDYIAQ